MKSLSNTIKNPAKNKHSHKKFYVDKHFYVNIIVGVIIAVIFHFVEYTRFGIKNLDYIFDFFIQHESLKAQDVVNRGETLSNFSKDIVFIDFRYSDYKRWGFPQFTPRDILARNIFLADSCGAKLIIIDFLFEYKDYQYPSKDDSLRNVIKRIGVTGKTKIIFPVTIGIDKKLKPNLFDDLINKYDNLFIGLPSVLSSSHDGVVRYTGSSDKYLESSEESRNTQRTIESIPVIASKILNNPALGKNDLIKQEAGENDNKNELTSINEKEREVEEYLYQKRIRFLIIPGKETDTLGRSGNILPDQYFAVENVIPEYLKNKAVIIGSSNPETGDVHLTPIGKLPGMFVLGNAVNTEIMHLYPEEVHIVLKYLIELLVILLASFLFYYFHEFFAQIITSILLLLILGTINYFLFLNYGIFLNFILPVLGIGLHRSISSFENILSSGISKKH
jgi:hypothetical protein